MRCRGCFKEFEEGDKAYATIVGSIERDLFSNSNGELGFYMDDIEPWLSVLCRDSGMALHNDFIADTLHTKYFENQKQSGELKEESD